MLSEERLGERLGNLGTTLPKLPKLPNFPNLLEADKRQPALIACSQRGDPSFTQDDIESERLPRLRLAMTGYIKRHPEEHSDVGIYLCNTDTSNVIPAPNF